MSKKSATLCHAPLYRQMATAIRSHIGIRYAVGDQLPVEKELAAEYQVSLITVKGALSILREEGIISSCRGKGTFVERLPSASHVAILIEYDYEQPGFNCYYRQLVESVSQYLADNGTAFKIYKGSQPIGEKPAKLTARGFLQDLKKGRIGGVIALEADPTMEWKMEVESRSIPLLGMFSEYSNAVLWNVKGSIDYAVRRMMDYSCKRIAAVGWEGFRGENHAPRDYLQRVLSGYGLPLLSRWFVSDLYPLQRGAGWEEFREIWTSSGDKPDGLLVLDGELLPDIYQAIQSLKIRLPQDLKIISQQVSDPEFNSLTDIEYFRQPPEMIAEQIVQQYQRLATGHAVGHLYVPTLFLEQDRVFTRTKPSRYVQEGLKSSHT